MTFHFGVAVSEGQPFIAFKRSIFDNLGGTAGISPVPVILQGRFFITLKYSKLLFRLSRVLKLYKVDQSKITNRFKIIFINKKNTKFKSIMYINR